MLWIVRRETLAGQETYGPFATPARASGWGFSSFGINPPDGRLLRWWVTPIRDAR